MTSRARRTMTAVATLAMVNFVTYFLIAIHLGGDAINGREVNGSYFLSAKGVLTEVSFPVFVYSYVHTVSVWITHGLVMVTFLVLEIIGESSD